MEDKGRGRKAQKRVDTTDLRYIGAGGTVIQTVPVLTQATAPLSGTSGSYATNAPAGSLLINTANGVRYVNEGSLASPYWTPLPEQSGLKGIWTDFRDVNDIIAASNTDPETILRSGLRVFGLGKVETDSGLTLAAEVEEGNLASLIATDQDGKLLAIGMGDTVPLFQPDAHETLVIDVEFTHNTAITLRATFCGFTGSVADAMTPRVTGTTTTITLVDNDVAGLFQDVGLNDTDGLFLPWNKANGAENIATTATGVDLSTTIAAAATFQRWRVEISVEGVVTAFVNKAQVGRIASAVDITQELMPVFYLESTSSATKQADVRRISMWANR